MGFTTNNIINIANYAFFHVNFFLSLFLFMNGMNSGKNWRLLLRELFDNAVYVENIFIHGREFFYSYIYFLFLINFIYYIVHVLIHIFVL